MKKTLIVAEAGINHMGDLQTAKDLVYAARESGCDAVKFQTYITEKRVSSDSPIFDILKKCELTKEQQTELKLYADEIGIEFFSTPFDIDALRFLVDFLGIRKIKLASFDVTNLKLLYLVNEYARALPHLNIIMSVGMANISEIKNALNNLSNVQHLTLLHCVSSYPTPNEAVNLEAIRTLKYLSEGRFGVGYSDHSPANDILAAALSVLMGAEVIERHFTLDTNNGAPDNTVSSDPASMKELVEIVRVHEMMLGDGKIGLKDIEKDILKYRRYS